MFDKIYFTLEFVENVTYTIFAERVDSENFDEGRVRCNLQEVFSILL